MTLVEPEIDIQTEETTDEGEKRYTHIVTPAAAVMEAMVNGTPVTALCGYTWIPSRDPEKFPICQKCLDIYKKLGERNSN